MRAVRLLAVVALCTACGVQRTSPAADVPASATPLPFVSVLKLQYSSLVEEAHEVVKSRADWANLWSAATSGFDPPRDVPTVDFGRVVVLVAALGRRPTGGYEVFFTAVYEDEEHLYAIVTEVSPGIGCLTSQAFTAPVAIVTVPRREKPVRFVERADVRNCG